MSWLRFGSWAGCIGSLCLLLASAGCESLNMRSQNPDEEEDAEAEFKVDKIGDHVMIGGIDTQQIEAVGLVTGLDGTGGNPSPGLTRDILTNEMKKENIPGATQILESPDTALVLVKAILPPAIQIGDRFDVEIMIPDSANATSLAGGYLLPCGLSEQAISSGGRNLKGHDMGRAAGPIMVANAENPDDTSKAGHLRRGRILGGGVYTGGPLKKGRSLELYLRSDFRSVRNSDLIAKRIGRRFHTTERGRNKPLAKATTDQHIQLEVHPLYRENYIRYLQVIRQIAFMENPVEEHARLERLKKKLLVPQTASEAAMDLEAIGGDGASDVLRVGLRSPNEEVRFYSADALAYLGHDDGAKELAIAAEREQAFRVFALAALAVLNEGEANVLLRGLMNEMSTPIAEAEAVELDEKEGVVPAAAKTVTAKPEQLVKHDGETRYGAFRTLWTLDRLDPFLRGEVINQQFNLHPLRTTGEPMVHVSRTKVQEIVLFGADQELRRPIALTAGTRILINAPLGSDTVTVSRFEPGRADQQKVVSPKVADVIRAVGELNGTYPDVVQMLTQAKRQANLEGPLEIDALPQAGRIYRRRPNSAGPGTPADTQVTLPDRTPNIFSGNDHRRTEGAKAEESNSGAKPSSPDSTSGSSGSTNPPAGTGEPSRSATQSSSTPAPANSGDTPAGTTAADDDFADPKDDSATPAQPGFLKRLFSNPFKPSVSGDQSEPE